MRILALFIIYLNLFALDFKNGEISAFSDINAWLFSEKLDGIQGVWDGKILRTKNGNEIAIPPCFRTNLESLPLKNNEILRGELWIGRNNFEKISSITRLKSPSCEDYKEVKFMIFDSSDFGDSNENFLKRMQDLKKREIPQMFIIEQIALDSRESLEAMFKNITQNGGEGIIARKNNLALKLKPQNDAECEIIGYTQGKGRLKNKVGAIICKSLGDEKIRADSRFKIGSGLSDDFRKSPPKIGTIITYKYGAISKNGIPKHTRFWRIYRNVE